MADYRSRFKENVSERKSWIRILLMSAFGLLLVLIIAPIVGVLALTQSLFLLVTGATNADLRQFGGILTRYVGAILEYLTFNREQPPFPFTDRGATRSSEALLVKEERVRAEEDVTVAGLLQKPGARARSGLDAKGRGSARRSN